MLLFVVVKDERCCGVILVQKGLFSVVLVRYCQFLAAMSAARCQYATTILGSHSLTEAVLVHATAIVGLERSFHFALSFYCYYRYNALRERRGHSRYGLQNYGFFLK